jgi:LDH2 family malate/lactate/ureidoglycolate dehydrogenase
MTETKIDHKQLKEFTLQLLCASGGDVTEAEIVADVLVWSNLVGRESQGVWRLKELLPSLRSGAISSPCYPDFMQKTDSVVVMDAHHGFGRYAGQVAMQKSIEMARQFGVGLVAVRNSKHYGAGAYYAQLAAREDMLGIALTNSARRVAAYGGTTPVFGTNPFAFGAPLRSGESVLIDFSTSAMSGSMIRKGAETNESIPEGVAVDQHGNTVTDSKHEGYTILPFGGAKGYCLSLFVEILSGVVTGSLMSFQILNMLEKPLPSARIGIGHFFLAINITTLLQLDEYYERMEMLVAEIKKSKLQMDVAEIMIPGETRWRNYAEQLREGIRLDQKTTESLKSMANELGVATPW